MNEEKLLLEGKLISFDESLTNLNFLQSLSQNLETANTTLNEQITTLNSTSAQQTVEIENLGLEIVNLKENSEMAKSTVANIEAQLIQVTLECTQKMSDLELASKKIENNYNIELSIHKEQIKQHSLTIVSFEKDIIW